MTIPVEATLFKFVVDGEWKIDETAATETDEHGNVNNVLTVEVLESYEGDIQELTQDIPGAFPEAAVIAAAAAPVSRSVEPQHDVSPSHISPEVEHQLEHNLEAKREAVASGAVVPEGSENPIPAASTTSQKQPVSHDLQPSHLDADAASKLEHAIETKYEAVEGGSVVPENAVNPIPAASTTSQTEPISHDLTPSQLDPKSASKLEHAIETKYEAVESGTLDPVDASGNSRAVPSSASPTQKTRNPAVPVASFPAISHDLQPSVLDPKAADKLEHAIETKHAAVESGALDPVDSVGGSRAVPSATTSATRSPGLGSGFDEVTPSRKSKDVAFAEHTEADLSPEVGDAYHESFGKLPSKGSSQSRFQENDVQPVTPPSMSPHLSSLAQRGDIPLDGSPSGVATPVTAGSNIPSGSATPISRSLQDSASDKLEHSIEGTTHDLQPSRLDPRAATKLADSQDTKLEAVEGGAFTPVAPSSVGSSVPGSVVEHQPVDPLEKKGQSLDQLVEKTARGTETPSSTAANVAVPVSPKGSRPTSAAPPRSDETPNKAVAAAQASAGAAETQGGIGAEMTPKETSVADVTITAGAHKKEKRRSFFRKIKDILKD